jgi:hypothetical protein
MNTVAANEVTIYQYGERRSLAVLHTGNRRSESFPWLWLFLGLRSVRLVRYMVCVEGFVQAEKVVPLDGRNARHVDILARKVAVIMGFGDSMRKHRCRALGRNQWQEAGSRMIWFGGVFQGYQA